MRTGLSLIILLAQFTPALQATEARPLLSGIRQLSFEGRRSGEAYFSADGRQMVFQSEREGGNPFYQIYLMDLETGDTRRISSGTGKTTCAWVHPNGKRILFASTHEDPQAKQTQREELDKRASGQGSRYSWSFDEHYELYEADSWGNILRRLTKTPGYDAEGSWSPDGKLILFASNRHAYEGQLSTEDKEHFERDPSYFMELYLMDADGGNIRRLTQSPGYDGGPFFSADGRRIVWRRFGADGHSAEIWTMDADGSNARQITQLGLLSWAPYFHPSGDYIIFANNSQGHRNFELYLVDAKGENEPVRVTHSDGFDGLPVFTPDGTSLAWSSSRGAGKKAQIFVADWDDAAARKVLGLSETSGEMIRATIPAAGSVRTSTAITEKDLRLHLGFLADPAQEGRLTGSPGAQRAADHVALAFQSSGLQPAGDMGGWNQYFSFKQAVKTAPGNQLLFDDKPLELNRDWRPLAFSGTGEVQATETAFAGYGIVAPATADQPALDSYGDLDVQGRWVLVFRHLPEDIDPERRQHLGDFASARHKAMLARDKGAAGLILVAGSGPGFRHELIPLESEAGAGSSSLPVLSVSREAGARILGLSLEELDRLQKRVDQGTAHPLAEATSVLSADIRLHHQTGLGRNVLGRLNAGDGPGDELVVIGAHLDHIGYGKGMDSLADGTDAGKVHPGADDNASGVAALLEIVQYLVAEKRAGRFQPRRDILFATWSGEELGRLGSAHFIDSFRTSDQEQPGLTPEVSAYLNMDMVGRLDQYLYLQGSGSSSVWSGEIERRNVPVGLPIRLRKDGYLPTDATSFYLAGIPVLSAFTGAHSDYNTPRDTADRINYEGLGRIARLMALLTRSMALREQAPDYIETDKPKTGASRANLRAYLGTVPDYAASDIQGVKLNGVAKGGPAEKAGLHAEDVIVNIAGREIENIYDFTYALNALKVGQAVEIRVRRDGGEVSLQAVPEARE